ncbi:uncharacterized protein si:dkey-9i23.16 [Plectropomus leopardus]|uniref:uncharacterized protein si:dkey-9i23.16 n=1 Tax=Plectropomus leopardus TaxID=160734 RepID=UPI001C4D0517|nr:uncharacterized protein si:dkey-9i23.16 [Plectropomus leopardus]
MSSDGAVTAAEPRLHRLFPWFDPYSAAVVTILLGLFQVILSIPLSFVDPTLPKLFVAPLFIGIIIVVGGSFTIAYERDPSRLLLQGCVCSNLVGLLGTLISFCIYCYSLSNQQNKEPCDSTTEPSYDYDYGSRSRCAGDVLSLYTWNMILLLVLYNIGAVIMHSLLSVSALKAFKTE